MHKISRVYFILFGALDLLALLTAFIYSLNFLVEFFSYFTVLSNILITFVFLSLGLKGINRGKKAKNTNVLYGPAVLYMTITGVVFWTLLHGGAGHLQRLPWVNITLHGITPIVAFVGWILFPTTAKISYSSVFYWLLFPLLFVFYTLLRGPFVNWYPYVILNPGKVGGYEGVGKYVLIIIAGAYITGLILVFIRRKLRQ